MGTAFVHWSNTSIEFRTRILFSCTSPQEFLRFMSWMTTYGQSGISIWATPNDYNRQSKMLKLKARSPDLSPNRASANSSPPIDPQVLFRGELTIVGEATGNRLAYFFG